MTAPYSPSQNGVAERMNGTLVELARTMISAQDLPEFLWEPAVAHAAYLRNRAYTEPLKEKTPYEIWMMKKPNVSHLREFGAPVWVLLQGQHVQRKMLPKSKRRVYIGFDEGSKSVQYYNAETRKVLTSRNFRFLSLAEKDTPAEEIEVLPDAPREGESEEGTLPTGTEKCDSLKRKRSAEDAIDLDAPRKTRGIRPDYRYLNDPFPDEENSFTSAETFATHVDLPYGDDIPKSLNEVRSASEWPEWEHTVQWTSSKTWGPGYWLKGLQMPFRYPTSGYLRKSTTETATS